MWFGCSSAAKKLIHVYHSSDVLRDCIFLQTSPSGSPPFDFPESRREGVFSHDVSALRFSDVVDHDSDVPHGFSTSDYVFHDLSSVFNSRLSDFGRCASGRDCALPEFSHSQ